MPRSDLPTDEGTMMLEEVHAVAPGATLLFCGPQTPAFYVTCLQTLIANGATIIVDDIAYTGQPLDVMSAKDQFAQGIQNTLTQSQGVVLFTVTENYNGSYWEGAYTPVSLASFGLAPFVCSANGQTDQYIESFNNAGWDILNVVASGAYITEFAWADPFDQNTSDFDLYVVDLATSTIAACFPGAGSATTNMWGSVNWPAGNYALVIGTPDSTLSGKFLKIFILGDTLTTLSLSTSGSTVSPQAFVPGVVTVGAVKGSDGVGGQVEGYSGRGPINLAFPVPTQLQAPSEVAPDAIYVDAAGTHFTTDSSGYFDGTSAAAPNAAAVAALLRSGFPSLTPTQLANVLQSGAVQLGSTVPDGTYGRVDAIGALGAIAGPSISGFTTTTIVGGSSSTSLPINVGGTGNLKVSVSPASLIPGDASGVQLSPANCGSGSNVCSVILTPSMGQTGSTMVTLTVTDGANRTASYEASVTVTKPPSPTVAITSGGSQNVNVNAPLSAVAFTLKGTGPLTVAENSSGVSQLLISQGCGTTSMQCTATLGNAGPTAGTETLSISATDSYGQVASAKATFNVTQPPSGSSGGGGSIDLISLLGLAALTCVGKRHRASSDRKLPRLPLD